MWVKEIILFLPGFDFHPPSRRHLISTRWATDLVQAPFEATHMSSTATVAATATSTAIIVHPTHSKGLLSSIIPTLRAVRQVVLPYLPNGPRIVSLHQGTDHLNVGVLLWRSGIAMSMYLGKEIHEQRMTMTNKRVLELGCGCSPLVSMVAAAYGAHAVATDYDSEVLSLATLNVRKNHIGTGKRVQVASLKWGEEDQIQAILGCNLTTGTTPFDYVFAADVMYAPQTHNVLIETMIKVGNDNTIYYIGYQNRFNAHESTFFKTLLPTNGFVCDVVWTGDEDRVSIVRCVRKN